VKDIEILIIGDGTTDRTREIVAELSQDERVRFFDFPKGPRHGELYRHEVLKTAQGKIVAYLSDDDLWFPNHLECMLKQLENADFANAATLYIEADGQIMVSYCNLASSYYRQEWDIFVKDHDLVDRVGIRNGVVLSAAAHSLDYYHKLPFGWRTTPKPLPTDLYMWIQFLSQTDCIVSSGTVLTVLKFLSPGRMAMTNQARFQELEAWRRRFQSRQAYTELIVACLEAAIQSAYREVDEMCQNYERSRVWKLRKMIRKLPIAKDVGQSIIRQLIP
jgi:glycosyltransferase involved in cell wall biosynthesis